MKRIALVFGLLLGAIVHAQEKFDIFGDDKRSFVLLPAEVVSSGTVLNVEFSRSGRYITYTKMDSSTFEDRLLSKDVPLKLDWFRYDRVSHLNVRIPIPATTTSVILMGDEQTVYYSGFDPKDPQGFLNLKSGANAKTNFSPENLMYTGENSTANYFMVKQGDRQVMLVQPNGQSMTITLPPKVVIYKPTASDASTMTFGGVLKASPSKVGHLLYNRSDGSTKFVEMSRQDWSKEMEGDAVDRIFWFESVGGIDCIKLRELPKEVKTVMPLRANLAISPCIPVFGPNNDCVAYQDAGALLVREIKPLDLDLAKKLLASEAKLKAMKDAKQAALALLIYASDMDDVFPGAEGWDTKVLPYSKDADLLKRFNYTFKGGGAGSIDSPATTEIGFTLGPGGRAVAYMDGHVKWIPDP